MVRKLWLVPTTIWTASPVSAPTGTLLYGAGRSNSVVIPTEFMFTKATLASVNPPSFSGSSILSPTMPAICPMLLDALKEKFCPSGIGGNGSSDCNTKGAGKVAFDTFPSTERNCQPHMVLKTTIR